MAMSRQHVTRTKKFSMIRLHSKQVVSTKTAQHSTIEQGGNIGDHGRRGKVGWWKAGQGWSEIKAVQQGACAALSA